MSVFLKVARMPLKLWSGIKYSYLPGQVKSKCNAYTPKDMEVRYISFLHILLKYVFHMVQRLVKVRAYAWADIKLLNPELRRSLFQPSYK